MIDEGNVCSRVFQSVCSGQGPHTGRVSNSSLPSILYSNKKGFHWNTNRPLDDRQTGYIVIVCRQGGSWYYIIVYLKTKKTTLLPNKVKIASVTTVTCWAHSPVWIKLPSLLDSSSLTQSTHSLSQSKPIVTKRVKLIHLIVPQDQWLQQFRVQKQCYTQTPFRTIVPQDHNPSQIRV